MSWPDYLDRSSKPDDKNRLGKPNDPYRSSGPDDPHVSGWPNDSNGSGEPDDWDKSDRPNNQDDNAKDWLYYLAPKSITSSNDLKRLFLAKFFPTSRTTTIIKEISGIKQQSGESLYEYWERFKNLCSSSHTTRYMSNYFLIIFIKACTIWIEAWLILQVVVFLVIRPSSSEAIDWEHGL